MSSFRARLASEEHGLTLVELLVVIAVTVVLGGFVFTSLIQGMRTTSYSQDRVDALAAAQTGLERMSRELRAADPVRSISDDAVALDVRRDESLFHYQYETRADGAQWELVEERWQFDDPDEFDAPGFVPTEPGPAYVTESVLVADLDDAAVFAFTDEAGGDTTSPSAARHARIELERVVQDDRPPIIVDTTVKLRNH